MYENDSESDEDVEESDKNPNPKLSQGSKIPRRYGTFPIHLANTPIVDMDPFFKDKRTYIVVSNSNRLVCPKCYTGCIPERVCERGTVAKMCFG